MIRRKEIHVGGKPLIVETGKIARQADGAVTVRCGDTVVLVTVCAAKSPREGVDFLPLTVDYRENTYAAGKIPGGFFRREGRPNEKEVLTSRFIDRPLRPLFPTGWACETQSDRARALRRPGKRPGYPRAHGRVLRARRVRTFRFPARSRPCAWA